MPQAIPGRRPSDGASSTSRRRRSRSPARPPRRRRRAPASSSRRAKRRPFACSLDGVALAGCDSPVEVSGLELGEHDFEVAATDPSGNTGTATHVWTVVDVTAPTVTLTGPPAETEDASATFEFSASEARPSCASLDGAALASCDSPGRGRAGSSSAHTPSRSRPPTRPGTRERRRTRGRSSTSPRRRCTLDRPARGDGGDERERSSSRRARAATFVCTLDGGRARGAATRPSSVSGLASGAAHVRGRRHRPVREQPGRRRTSGR